MKSFSVRITAYFGAFYLLTISGLFSIWYFGFPPFGISGERYRQLNEATRTLETAANFGRTSIINSLEERRGDITVITENKILIQVLKNHKDQNPEKIDAVFFCSRKVFITGVRYMYKNAIKIPEDMEVVCFDKIDSFAIANIPIIYIEQPIKKMGEKAVDVLMEQIKGSDTIKQCVFDTELMYMN